MPLENIAIGTSQVGGGTVGVPKLVGKTRDEAAADLAKLNLKANFVDITTVGTEGVVFSQEPPEATIRRSGTTVTVQIVKNPSGTPGVPDDKLDQILTEVGKINTTLAKVETQETSILTKLDEVLTKLPKPTEGSPTSPPTQ